jgi:hypothetical protein
MTNEHDKSKKKPEPCRPGGKTKRIAIRTALVLLALLAGCDLSSSKTVTKTGPKTGYLHSNDDSVTFVRWEQVGQKLEGTIVVLDRDPGGKARSGAFVFHGTLNGENVSLTLDSATTQDGYHKLDKTITGELRGNTLTLPPVNGADGAAPVVFHSAGQREFADATENLQKRAKTTDTAK